MHSNMKDVVIIQHQLDNVLQHVVMNMPQYVVLQEQHIKIDVIQIAIQMIYLHIMVNAIFVRNIKKINMDQKKKLVQMNTNQFVVQKMKHLKINVYQKKTEKNSNMQVNVMSIHMKKKNVLKNMYQYVVKIINLIEINAL